MLVARGTLYQTPECLTLIYLLSTVVGQEIEVPVNLLRINDECFVVLPEPPSKRRH